MIPGFADSSAVDERVFWAMLTEVKGIGPAQLRRLVEMFGDARSAWYADSRALVDAGLERRARNALMERRKELDPVEHGNRISAAGVELVRVIDPAYPALLKGVPDAPAVLFVKGRLLSDDEPSIAVVGTRRATAYGRQAAEKIAGELARAEWWWSAASLGVSTQWRTTRRWPPVAALWPFWAAELIGLPS